MNTDEKILKAIDTLQADVREVKADVATIKTEHGKRLESIEKTQERLENRQVVIEQEVYEIQSDQKAIKGMIQLVNSNVVKTAKENEKRIENLEEHTGTENPLKH